MRARTATLGLLTAMLAAGLLLSPSDAALRTIGAGYLDPRFGANGTTSDPAEVNLGMVQDRTGRIFVLFSVKGSGPGGRDVYLRARTANGWIDRGFNGGKPLKMFHTTNWQDSGYGYGHSLWSHPTGVGVRVMQSAVGVYSGGKVVTLTVDRYGKVTAKGWAPFAFYPAVALADGRLRGCSPAGDVALDPSRFAGLTAVGNPDRSLSPSGLLKADGTDCEAFAGVDAEDRLYAVDAQRPHNSDPLSITVKRWSKAGARDTAFGTVSVPFAADSRYYWPTIAVVSPAGATFVAVRVGEVTPRTGLVRVEADGRVSAFGGDGVAIQTPPAWMASVRSLQPSSVALVGGQLVMSVHGSARQADGKWHGVAFLTRMSATTGATDPTFGRQGWVPIPFDAEVTAGRGGSILLAGTVNASSTKSAAVVQRRFSAATTVN